MCWAEEHLVIPSTMLGTSCIASGMLCIFPLDANWSVSGWYLGISVNGLY